MDMFEREYHEGLGETAADQFLKLAAELDGSNVMDKLNPGDVPQGAESHPSGVDARALEPGLRAVEKLREGRGKITALVTKTHPKLSKSIGRDDVPILSGGLEEVPSRPVERLKTAMEKRASLPDAAATAMAGALLGAIGGAVDGAAGGAIAGGLAGPRGKRWETARQGLGSGMPTGAITGAISGAAIGALTPSAPKAALTIAKITQPIAFGGGIAAGLVEANRARTGAKPILARKQYAAALTKRKQASFRSMVEKVASEGRLRTLDGWRG